MSCIGQLVVRFERDMEPRKYTYLGQCCLMGKADHLVEDYDCKRVVEFSPRYGSPAAQMMMGEVMQGDGKAGERLEQLSTWTPPAFWVLPDAGWRTARCLQAALASGGPACAGVLDIIAPLSEEVDDWLEIMNIAVEADVRFQVDMEECPTPPPDLIAFVEQDFAETVALIREALEEAGIEITEEEEDDA